MGIEEGKIYSDFEKASRQIGLPIKKILDMFYWLSKNKTVENNRLIRLTGVSKNVLNQTKTQLSQYFGPVSNHTSINQQYKKVINNIVVENYQTEETIWSFLENSQFKEIVTLLNSFKPSYPRPDRKLDQFTATIETTAKRACLLNFFGDIKGKKILFLGDNDFTSIATAYFNLAHEITVVDIDDRILKVINSIAKKHKLKIETIQYDLREPIPEFLKNKFNIVFTDPPYTPSGIKLFLSRAIQTIDQQNKSARIYLCFGNSDRAKERFLPILEILNQAGIMIRWIFDKFNRYHGAESIGSSSSLFICEVTPKTKPLTITNQNEKIYTAD